jgi:hypothetical protein
MKASGESKTLEPMTRRHIFFFFLKKAAFMSEAWM